MNRIISDTAEYGCYLFDHSCKPLIQDYVNNLEPEVLGLDYPNQEVDPLKLSILMEEVRKHPVEKVGAVLRKAMTAMKQVEVY